MKRNKLLLLLFLLNIATIGYTQDILKRPEPPRLVNDFTGILNVNEVESLETKLVEFDNNTSTQIAVVIVNDLNGYDANQLAYEIGQKWGVGQKGKNNGIVVLVKPKTSDSQGYAAISVAYGLEDTVTDALAKRIVENEMIPRFRLNDYFGGINSAVTILMDVTKGKYTAGQYYKNRGKSKAGKGFGAFIFILIIFLFFIMANNNKRSQHSIGRSGSNLPFWLLMGGMLGSSGRSGGGSW